MNRRVQIQDSVMGEWRDVPESTRVRFLFEGRWQELGLDDSWIEAALSPEGDFVALRGDHRLSLGLTSGNALNVSPNAIEGGMTEIGRLRKRELELVAKLNAAFQERIDRFKANVKRRPKEVDSE
jgi:hypothetical protein